jgi:hypothetical protein
MGDLGIQHPEKLQGMKKLAMTVLLMAAIAVSAQVSLIPTNQAALLVSSSTNTLSVSNAIRMLSGLRLGMEQTNIDSYLGKHGITNRAFGNVSVDRGQHYYCYYDFPGTDCTLVLQTRSRRTGPGLFDWGYPVLEGGCIRRVGVDTFLITFTNAP